MKLVVLLALAGLASCRTALIGGDRARDVTIEYSYLDDQGKEVTVEVKADKLGLDLNKDDSKLSVTNTGSSLVSRPVQHAQIQGFLKPETKIHFVQVEREPTPVLPQFLRVEPQPAPKPQVETRFVQVQPQPAPKPQVETRFVQVHPQPAPRPQVETRFVQVQPQPAPRPQVETRFVQVQPQPAPKPQIETRFVQVQPQPAPGPQLETRFIQVAAEPVPQPPRMNQFVQVEPVVPKQEVPTVHFFEADDFPAPAPKTEVRFIKAEAAPELKPKVETRFVHVEAPRQEVVTSFIQTQPAPVTSTAFHRQPSKQSRDFSNDDDSAEK